MKRLLQYCRRNFYTEGFDKKKARLSFFRIDGPLELPLKTRIYQNRLNLRGPPLTGVASIVHIPRP